MSGRPKLRMEAIQRPQINRSFWSVRGEGDWFKVESCAAALGEAGGEKGSTTTSCICDHGERLILTYCDIYTTSPRSASVRLLREHLVQHLDIALHFFDCMEKSAFDKFDPAERLTSIIMYHTHSHNPIAIFQPQQIIHHSLTVKVAIPASEIAPALNAIHNSLRIFSPDREADDRHSQLLTRSFFAVYGYVLPLSQIRQQHLLQFLLVHSNCSPSGGFVRTEIGDDGRKCGHELVAGGCKTELGFEIGAGVKVMTEGAKSLLGGPGGIKDRYMRTIDLRIVSVQRFLE